MNGKNTSEHIQALRAEDELRRQRGVVVRGAPDFAFIPIESLDEESFSQIQKLAGTKLRAVLTGERAKTICSLKDAAVGDIDAGGLNFEQLQALGDPLVKVQLPKLAARPAGPEYRAALGLVKFASLLPAVLVIEGNVEQGYFKGWLEAGAQELQDYIARPHTEIFETARAKLPVEGAENTTLVSFREHSGASVHLALVVGKLSDSPLVRVHSSCVTGDILGSLRCDCGGQLQLALSRIIAEGSGVLLYLHQEGRGIGITNKLRAYKLQEQGVDTYDANLMLGFEEDERDFSIAAGILKKLGVGKIRMLTNNPHKLENLEQHGIAVAERVPLITKEGVHNHTYLDAKAKKSGHLF